MAAGQLQSWAWAESMQGCINSQQKTFLEFCHECNITSFPVSGDIMTEYAAWLMFSGRLESVGSLKQYLSAVSTLHKMFGFECHTPLTYGPLKFTVGGIKRRLSRPPRKMNPITAEILYNILVYPLLADIVSNETMELMVTIRAFYTVAYFSMLQCSNLVPTTASKIDMMMVLTWGGIRAFEDGVVITVLKSKMNQHQERIHQVAISWLDNSLFCPLAALERVMAIRGLGHCKDNDLVFLYKSGEDWTLLLRHTVVGVLRDQISGMGLNPAKYSPHSFRFGSLQESLLADPSLNMVRLQSDHISDAINGYLALPGCRRMRISQLVGDRLAAVLQPPLVVVSPDVTNSGARVVLVSPAAMYTVGRVVLVSPADLGVSVVFQSSLP